MKDLVSKVKDTLKIFQQLDYPLFEFYKKAVLKNIIEDYRKKTKNESLELVIRGDASFEKIYGSITNRKDNILSYIIPRGMRKKERKLLEENRNIIPIPYYGLEDRATESVKITCVSPHLGNYVAGLGFSTAYIKFGNIPLDCAIIVGFMAAAVYAFGSLMRHDDLEETREAKAELKEDSKLLDKTIRDVYPIIAKTADDPMDRFEESIITKDYSDVDLS